MHPYAQPKIKWDLMVAVLIVYSTLSVPFRIGFEEEAGVFGTIVDTVVDVGFTLDIVLSFRTAFIDEVSLETSGRPREEVVTSRKGGVDSWMGQKRRTYLESQFKLFALIW